MLFYPVLGVGDDVVALNALHQRLGKDEAEVGVFTAHILMLVEGEQLRANREGGTFTAHVLRC